MKLSEEVRKAGFKDVRDGVADVDDWADRIAALELEMGELEATLKISSKRNAKLILETMELRKQANCLCMHLKSTPCSRCGWEWREIRSNG